MMNDFLAFYSDMVEEEGKYSVASYDLSGEEAINVLSSYVDLSNVSYASLHCEEYETGIKSITAHIMDKDAEFQEKRLFIFQDICLVDMSIVETKKSIVQLLNPNIAPQKIHESKRNIHESSISFFLPTTNNISSIPDSTASSTRYCIIGLSKIVNMHFGKLLHAGKNLVANPATGITAFFTLIVIFPLFNIKLFIILIYLNKNNIEYLHFILFQIKNQVLK